MLSAQLVFSIRLIEVLVKAVPLVGNRNYGGKYKTGTSLLHGVYLSSKILQKAMHLFSEIQYNRRHS